MHKLLLLFPALLLFGFHHNEKEQFPIAAKINCPVVCQIGTLEIKEDPKFRQNSMAHKLTKQELSEGFAIDIFKEIFNDEDIDIFYSPKKSDDEVIKKTENAMYQAAIAITKSQSEKLKLSNQPIAIRKNSFFVRTDNFWNYKTLSSLQSITLGLEKNKEYKELSDYIEYNKHDSFRISFSESKNSFAENLKKLLKGNITAIYVDDNFMKYYLKENQLNDKIRFAGSTQEEYLYLGFNPEYEKADQYIKIFDEGMENLRKSGKLKKILQKYGLKDWSN